MKTTTTADLYRSHSSLLDQLDSATPGSDWRILFAEAIDAYIEKVIEERSADGYPIKVLWEKLWKYLAPCIDLSHRPTAVDLFCGAGGFSLGIENAGFNVAVGVDIGIENAEYHAKNFPASKTICADISQLSGRDIFRAPHYKRLALVVGGPPCQGFSGAGSSDAADPRNNLILEFARLVGELQPQYFVMENVAGLLRPQHRPMVDKALQLFRDAGYVTNNPHKLNAVNYGVPQFRERTFIVGWQEGLPSFYLPSVVLPKSDHITAGMALCDLPDASDLPELLQSDSVVVEHWNWGYYSEYSMRMRKPPSHLSSLREYDPMLLNGCRIPTHEEETIERFASIPIGRRDEIARKSRLRADRPALTIRAGTGRRATGEGNYTFPAPIHYSRDRVISVLEAKRLFGSPDWFRVHPTRLVGGKQIGNSVPPPLAEAIGRQIMKVYQSRRIDLNTFPAKSTLPITVAV